MPLLSQAASALRVYLKARRELARGPKEALFLTRDGGRLRHPCCAAAPTCATSWSRWGTQASLQTTARYTRVDVDDL